MPWNRDPHRKTEKTTLTLVAAWLAALLAGSPVTGRAAVTRADNPIKAAGQIVEALDIPGADVCSCIPHPRTADEEAENCKTVPAGCPSFSTMADSPLRGRGVATGPLGFQFPRAGGSFAILSTGVVGSADNATRSGRTTRIPGHSS